MKSRVHLHNYINFVISRLKISQNLCQQHCDPLASGVNANWVTRTVERNPGGLKKEVSRSSNSLKKSFFWEFLQNLWVAITFCSGNIFRWFFLQKISTLAENHESGLYHQYLGQKKVGIDQKSVIVKPKFQNIRWPDLNIFLAEIFMMKPDSWFSDNVDIFCKKSHRKILPEKKVMASDFWAFFFAAL